VRQGKLGNVPNASGMIEGKARGDHAVALPLWQPWLVNGPVPHLQRAANL
jgi:hypothetical protein